MRQPDNIVYWLDDRPPLRLALGLALQQVAFLGALLAVPSVFAHSLGLSPDVFLGLAASTLLYSAAAVLLQSWGRYGIGAGIFLPVQGTAAVVPVLVVAVATPTGLAGGFGMFTVVGLSMIGFSFLIRRMRAIFTVEIAGLAMLLIGSGLGLLGLRLILSPTGGQQHPYGVLVAAATLATMIVCNVWAKSRLRLFATLTGLSVGLVLSVLLGMLGPKELAAFQEAPWAHIPRLQQFGWTFEIKALVPAIITGFALALTSMGAQTVAQRFNDADFKRPDLEAIGRGVRAEGLAQIIASLLNGMPMVASGGAASLALTSGCTSRHLAKWTAGLLVVFALCPKIIVSWILVPSEVLGALFVFLSAFATIGGLQMIGSRMLDNRRSLAVGLGVLIGMGFGDIHEQLGLPGLRAVAFSAFAVGLTVAVVLQALFRLGVHKRAQQRFVIAETHLEEMMAFIESQGRIWGARIEVVKRAELASWQAFELIATSEFLAANCLAIELETRFDEYSLTVIARYRGALPVIALHAPTADEMIEDEQAPVRLAGYLIGRLADDVKARQLAGGDAELRLVFKD